MNDRPLYVLVVGHGRTLMTMAVLESLFKHLKYPNIKYVVSDDRSGDGHLNALNFIFHKHNKQNDASIITTSNGRYNLGAAMNNGYSYILNAGGEFILELENDRILAKDLDLSKYVKDIDKTKIASITFKGGDPKASNFKLHEETINGIEYLITETENNGRISYSNDFGCQLLHKRLLDYMLPIQENVLATDAENEYVRRWNLKDKEEIEKKRLLRAYVKDFYSTTEIGDELAFYHIGMECQHHSFCRREIRKEYEYLNNGEFDRLICNMFSPNGEL